MENIWTDRNELDRINDNFDELYDQLKKTIFNLRELAPNSNLGNFGLYAGNKMRSMYRRYKDNNVDYANSEVNKAIEKYFMFQYDNAVYALKRFADKLNSVGNYVRLNDTRNFILSSPDIKKYKEICDSIYNFDIDKDSVTAINYVLDETLLFGVDINDLIDEYNIELRKLKVEKQVEHRNPEDHVVEIPEQELFILKQIIEDVARQLSEQENQNMIPQDETPSIQKIIRKNDKKNKE